MVVKKLRKFRPDLVLNLLHGRYGEDGYIQSILESEKVNYTHSGVLSSALAIDKEIFKLKFDIKQLREINTKYLNSENENSMIQNDKSKNSISRGFVQS